MLSFKEFILAEELGQTQRVYLGGKARAEKNDNQIRYLPTANRATSSLTNKFPMKFCRGF